jgi:hypothetical protein
MLLARLPASMSILWSDSRSERMLDGVASGWSQFPGSGLTQCIGVFCKSHLRKGLSGTGCLSHLQSHLKYMYLLHKSHEKA